MKATKCKNPTGKGVSKRFTLLETERRFRRACEQIVQLNYKMGDLEHRYKKAKTEGRRTFRYSLRLRLAAVEGLRNMYTVLRLCTPESTISCRFTTGAVWRRGSNRNRWNGRFSYRVLTTEESHFKNGSSKSHIHFSKSKPLLKKNL